MTVHRTHLRQISGAVFAALLATMPVACGQTYSPHSPSYSQPTYGQPTYGQPTYAQPTYSQPTYNQPAYSQSTYGQPTPAYTVPSYGSNTPSYPYPDNSQPSANSGYTLENPAAPAPQVQTLTPEQVADLTSSIALYPDPLLAAMLPAATHPDQIAAAQNWLQSSPRPDETSIQNLPFEAPIKTLLHYPDVLQLMAGHLDWTQALGAAFLYQPNDVMNSVQRWRSIAQAQGYLQTTAQQDIISNGTVIEILPPTPQMVYIPVYDPGVVFGPPRVYNRPVIDYRACGAGGGWLDYGLDWHDREVLVPTRPYWERHDRDNRWYDDYRRQAFYDRDRGDWDRNRNDNRVIVQPQRRDANRPAVAALPPPAPPQIERRAFVRDSLKPGVVYPQRIVTPTDQKVITPPPPQRLSDAQRAQQQQQAAQQAAAKQQAAQQAAAKQGAAQRLQQPAPNQQAAQKQAEQQAAAQRAQQQQAAQLAAQKQAEQQAAAQRAQQQQAAQLAAQKQAEQQAAAQLAQQQQAAQQAAQKQAEQPTAAQRAQQLKLNQQVAGQKAAEQQAAVQRAQQQQAAQQAAAQQAAAQQAARQQRERDAAAAQQAAAQQAEAQRAQQQAAEQQAAARQAAAQKAAADQQAAARQAAAQQAAAQQQAAQRDAAVRQAAAQQAAAQQAVAQQAAAQQAAARKAEEDKAAQQARGRNNLTNGLPLPPGRARGQETDPNIDNR